MRLDPALFADAAIPEETRQLNAKIVAAMTGGADWWKVGAAKVRAARLRGDGPFPAPVKLDRARWLQIEGPAGELKLRVLAPEKSRGVYLHMHGGGHVLGGADLQDARLARMADATGLTALSVEYRLAPESPFPAGPDDCEAAALWAAAHVGDFGGKALAIGGESAGAHLAALTLLRLRDKHSATPFQAANLVYGVFDLAMTPSARQFGAERLVLRTTDIEHFGDAFLPGVSGEALRDPKYSPLHASLKGLCPALFTIGTCDALVDDSLFMHVRWAAAGNDAELAIYPGACHGFLQYSFPQASTSLAQQGAFLNAALA